MLKNNIEEKIGFSKLNEEYIQLKNKLFDEDEVDNNIIYKIASSKVHRGNMRSLTEISSIFLIRDSMDNKCYLEDIISIFGIMQSHLIEFIGINFFKRINWLESTLDRSLKISDLLDEILIEKSK